MIGADTRAGDALVSHRPRRARPRRRAGDRGDRGRRRRRAGGRRGAPRLGPAQRRASAPRCSLRAAAGLRERRLEVAALAVRECAKPWPEADADVCEAIDFLEYYARGAIELEAGAELLQLPGRAQHAALRARAASSRSSARGTSRSRSRAAWSPPASRPATPSCSSPPSSRRAAPRAGRALREAGVPPDALALLPGEGDVGAALVRDPRVHTIAFTGSAAVGLEILRTAAETPAASATSSASWPRWAARTA